MSRAERIELANSALDHILETDVAIPRVRYPFSFDIIHADQRIRSYIHRGERILEKIVDEGRLGESVTEVTDPALVVRLRRIINFHSIRMYYFLVKHMKTYSYIQSTSRFSPGELNNTGQDINLPIKTDGFASWYAGLMPYSVWFQPAANIPRKVDVSDMLDVDSKYDRQVMIGGSWPTTQYHLQDMCRRVENALTVAQIRLTIPLLIDKMPSFTTMMPRKSEMKFVKVNPDSKPGMVSGIFSNNKGDSAAWALVAAKKVFDDIFCGKAKFNPCVWSLGARGRRHDWEFISSFHNTEDAFTPVDTRLVQVPEFPVHIVESLFQRKLAYYLHDTRLQVNKWYRVGHAMPYFGWRIMHQADQFGAYGMEGDWKSFDSLFYKSIVFVSFAILRSYFASTHISVNNFFSFFAHSFINRLVVTPGDFIYSVQQGVPSGTIWTNDVDTIGNMAVWAYIFMFYPGYRSLNPYTDIFMLAGGDDFLHVYKYPINIDGADLTAWVQSNIGWKIKDDYIFGPVWNRTDTEKGLTFYKCLLDPNGYPTRRVAEVVKIVNCPERKPKFSISKFVSQAGFGPPPGEAREAFCRLFARIVLCDEQPIIGTIPWLRKSIDKWMWVVKHLENQCDKHFIQTMLNLKLDKVNESSQQIIDSPLLNFLERSDKIMAFLGSPLHIAMYWLNWTWNYTVDIQNYRSPPWETYNAKRDQTIKLRRERHKERRKELKALRKSFRVGKLFKGNPDVGLVT